MDDALARVIHGKLGNTELAAVAVQCFDLQARYRVNDPPCTVRGGHIVVRHGKNGVGTPGFTTCQAQALKGLGRSHFVDKMAVYVQQGRPVIILTNEV